MSECVVGRRSIEPGETTVQNIVTAVASVENVDPTELQPLAKSVDPGALNRIVRTTNGAGIRIAFEYAGYEIVLNGAETVEVILHDD